MFDIPYFTHQQLDPHLYGLALSLPIGTSKPSYAPSATSPTNGTGGPHKEENNDTSNTTAEEAPNSRKPQKRRNQTKNASALYKKLKVTGGRPAMQKRVTADLDSDDEVLKDMKEAGYLEKDIVTRFVEEGRTKYHPKTIGTRWARIRRALAQKQDDLLDANMSDWHEGDDDALKQAIVNAEARIAKEIAKVENRRWATVAEEMKALKPVTNFSRNACRKRNDALQDGTAKPVPESIANPDQETLAKIARRQEKQRKVDSNKAKKISSDTSKCV